jgi:hypothetical protein
MVVVLSKLVLTFTMRITDYDNDEGSKALRPPIVGRGCTIPLTPREWRVRRSKQPFGPTHPKCHAPAANNVSACLNPKKDWPRDSGKATWFSQLNVRAT